MEFEEQLERDWRLEQEVCRRRFDAGVAALAPVFASARRVQSALLLPLSRPATPLDVWAGFSCYALGRERGREKDAHFAARLARLVLDADTYQLPGGGMKLCSFVPTVGFRVWGHKQVAEVVLCFGCSELMVLENDPAVPMHTIGGEAGRFRVCGDFDPAAERLKSLARETAPDWENSPLWRRR